MEEKTYISPSRLKTWLKCPFAFKLRYIDGLVPPPSANMFLGKIVHAGLEEYYRHKQRNVTLYADVVCERMLALWEPMAAADAVQFKSKEEEVSLRTKATELIATYLKQVPDDESQPMAVESRIEAPLIDPHTGDIFGTLVGIIDLILEGADGPIIRDFKTAARSSSTVDIIHELQLSCYSYLARWATKRIEAKLEICSLIKTKTPKVETDSYGAREGFHFDRLFSVIRAYRKSLAEGAFHIRPGLECSFCDYQAGACSKSNDRLKIAA